jgi:hypothetical protein
MPLLCGKEKLNLMNINLHKSFNDCAPVLPLESLSVDIPCLLEHQSCYLGNHKSLHSRLFVFSHDNIEITYTGLERAMRERNVTIDRYKHYV